MATGWSCERHRSIGAAGGYVITLEGCPLGGPDPAAHAGMVAHGPRAGSGPAGD